ncbi:hypothetical protein IC007_0567 [Sulfuracidifex tepidarius]|uniref:Uncharacterized protein n=1 Tax=Sulfuracidifex tepidarius TaxID=1294262 RepID=A0A510E0R3_9CREN|nr:hypothetical protein IC007_0567 [Sulfuracidifex tepidarius]
MALTGSRRFHGEERHHGTPRCIPFSLAVINVLNSQTASSVGSPLREELLLGGVHIHSICRPH